LEGNVRRNETDAIALHESGIDRRDLQIATTSLSIAFMSVIARSPLKRPLGE